MSLVLRVPEPISGQNVSVETNPKQVKAWLVSLSPANMLETSRAIFDALSTLNRVKLDTETRLRLLEQYQLAIDLLDAPLEAVYASAALPAKEKGRQASTLGRNLQLELAHGYKLALLERMAARFSFSNRQIPELIQLILLTHQKLMWVCCKSYTPLPAGQWLEAHTLFLHVIQNKLIDAPDGMEHPSKTLGGIYKHLLLLALVDPFRYHPSEHDKIYDLIKTYGAAAQFQPLTNAPHPAGFFLIRLDADSPPAFLGQKPYDAQPSASILLDTMDMARHLHGALQSVEAKMPVASDRARAVAWIDLLRRVARQWSIAPKRVFQRIRANSRVEVVGGLRLSVYYLNGRQPVLQPIELDETVIDERGPVSINSGLYNDPDRWVVLNESPGGYALRLQPMAQNCMYRIGDIVALRSEGEEGWMVACIRWAQTMDEGDAIEIGIQVLAPQGQSAMLKPTISAREANLSHCLLLPAVPALKQPPLIVAPRGTFSPMRELAVYTDDGERILRASKLSEQAVGYELFEYVSSPS